MLFEKTENFKKILNKNLKDGIFLLLELTAEHFFYQADANIF